MTDLKRFDNCKLKPAKSMEVIETDIAFIWLEDDILYYVAKKSIRTPQNLKTAFDAIGKLTDGKKVAALAEMNDVDSYENVPRQQSIEALRKHFYAVAIVTCTPMGKMLSNVAIVRNFNSPVKVFTDPAEAKKWLKSLDVK
jgi:hypothetical protein